MPRPGPFNVARIPSRNRKLVSAAKSRTRTAIGTAVRAFRSIFCRLLSVVDQVRTLYGGAARSISMVKSPGQPCILGPGPLMQAPAVAIASRANPENPSPPPPRHRQGLLVDLWKAGPRQKSKVNKRKRHPPWAHAPTFLNPKYQECGDLVLPWFHSIFPSLSSFRLLPAQRSLFSRH